jgi:hypothetical protein
MTKKAFDCIEMKRQVVYQAQQRVSGMSVAEKIAYYKAIGDSERAEQDNARRQSLQDLPKTGTD